MARGRAGKERGGASVYTCALLFAFLPLGAFAQKPRPFSRPPVAPRTAPQPQQRPNTPPPQIQATPQHPGLAHQPGHLGDWLKNHQGLNSEQLEHALRQEPGFNNLNPEQQQRAIKQLQQLNAMPPEQRQRRLALAESFEHLSPQQKQQVQSSFREFQNMPGDRQKVVRKALRDLRDIPSDQRQSVLNSPRFSDLTPQERNILGNMLVVEP